MQRVGRIALVASSGLYVLVCIAAVGASAAGHGVVKLPAYAPDGTGYSGPVATRESLPVGKLFVADVSGAVSYFAKDVYLRPSDPWDTVCGRPLASSEGPLGADAEFIFARPWTAPCPQELPVHWNNFELTTGTNGYGHPVPLGGHPTEPTAEHEYAYALVGFGAPAKFRLRDMPDGHPAAADNYGALTIRVREAVASDCAGSAYASFSEPTEAACVAAAALPGATQSPAANPSSSVLGVRITSPKACVSAREFTIHIQNAKQLNLASAVVSVNGHSKRILRGQRLSTVIDLRGLPKGTVTVEIVAREHGGQTVRGTRIYHTCRRGSHRRSRVGL